MRFTTAGLLVASATAVSAFTDTFPFIVASTKEFPKDVASNALLNKAVLATDELSSAIAPIISCPNVDHVLVWGERGLNAADFQHSKSFSTLKSTIKSSQGSLQIPEVRGELDVDDLLKTLNECGHKTLKISHFLHNEFVAPFDGSAKTVFQIEKTGGILGLDDLSQENADRSVRHERSRQHTLERDDKNLELALRKYNGKEYMLIYVGTPGVQWVPAATQGTPSDEYGNPIFSEDMLRQEIKRDSFLATKDDAPTKNGTARDTRPLFEKYQFFTPGLFMGLLVSLLLLSILFVGIRAISSLEVSYAAFEKEMGPGKKA